MNYLNRLSLFVKIANVENAAESTRLIAQTSLRNVLGTIDLSEILSNREDVSQHLREILKEATCRNTNQKLELKNFF